MIHWTYSTRIAACCSTASLSSTASCSSSCRSRRRRAAFVPHAAPRLACMGSWQPGVCAHTPKAFPSPPCPSWPWHLNPELPGFCCRGSLPQCAQAAPGVSRDVSRTVTFGWPGGSMAARVASARRSCRAQATDGEFAGPYVAIAITHPGYAAASANGFCITVLSLHLSRSSWPL